MKNNFKIDNHIIEITIKKIDLLSIYKSYKKENNTNKIIISIDYYYNNNKYLTQFFYNLKKQQFEGFTHHNFLTTRQENILKNKINRLVKNFDVDIKDFEELVKKYELFENGIHAEDLYLDEPERFMNLCINFLKSQDA